MDNNENPFVVNLVEIRKQDKEKIKERVKNSRPLDNDAFAYYASHKEFCEEFLRIILEDDNLAVVDNNQQQHLPNIYFKSSTIDVICDLSDSRRVDVEIQLYYETNEERAKRILHHVSMMRTTMVNKGDKYKDIDDIIVVYLTEDDFYGKGSTVYNVDMRVMTDTNIYVEDWKCGLTVKYVNTKGITNPRINDYLKMFTEKNRLDTKYPVMNEIKRDVVELGGEKMSEWMMDKMKKYEERGKLFAKIQDVNKIVDAGLATLDKALEIIGITKSDYESMMLVK